VPPAKNDIVKIGHVLDVMEERSSCSTADVVGLFPSDQVVSMGDDIDDTIMEKVFKPLLATRTPVGAIQTKAIITDADTLFFWLQLVLAAASKGKEFLDHHLFDVHSFFRLGHNGVTSTYEGLHTLFDNKELNDSIVQLITVAEEAGQGSFARKIQTAAPTCSPSTFWESVTMGNREPCNGDDIATHYARLSSSPQQDAILNLASVSNGHLPIQSLIQPEAKIHSMESWVITTRDADVTVQVHFWGIQFQHLSFDYISGASKRRRTSTGYYRLFSGTANSASIM